METIEFVEDVAIMKDIGQLSILSELLQKDCTILKATDYLQL